MWFYQLSLAVLLCVVIAFWRKNTRLQQRLNVFEAAEIHFSQGTSPINGKLLARLQSKVGELLEKETYDSENWQGAFDLFVDASLLINYWSALHPSEGRDSIDVTQQRGNPIAPKRAARADQ